MIWVEAADIDLLAQRGVGLAHNISSNLRLRSGLAPIAEMLSAGVAVGIGLDGQTLDDDQDFLREMRLAWTLANRSGMAAADVSASQAWRMGTEIAADITFGPTAGLGRLEAGAPADLVLFDWRGIRGKSALLDFPPAARVPGYLLRRANRPARAACHGGRASGCCGMARRSNSTSTRSSGEIYARLEFDAGGPAPDLSDYLRGFYSGWDDDDLPPPAKPPKQRQTQHHRQQRHQCHAEADFGEVAEFIAARTHHQDIDRMGNGVMKASEQDIATASAIARGSMPICSAA